MIFHKLQVNESTVINCIGRIIKITTAREQKRPVSCPSLFAAVLRGVALSGTFLFVWVGFGGWGSGDWFCLVFGVPVVLVFAVLFGFGAWGDPCLVVGIVVVV
jgi:hypothetical protein